ncbi:hypothetical protein OA90_12955 [Labrenzia sp. OB1]|nr:hypothetical protein OA90_12955 [Labrenzia sp. OB1]
MADPGGHGRRNLAHFSVFCLRDILAARAGHRSGPAWLKLSVRNRLRCVSRFAVALDREIVEVEHLRNKNPLWIMGASMRLKRPIL